MDLLPCPLTAATLTTDLPLVLVLFSRCCLKVLFLPNYFLHPVSINADEKRCPWRVPFWPVTNSGTGCRWEGQIPPAVFPGTFHKMGHEREKTEGAHG